ncbi:MAG: alkaline phosphatase family protein, partial [Pseudomonadota bacterium]
MNSSTAKGRVVVLGFDGMDFDLTESLIQSGAMPNLKKMIEKGCFKPLKSVFPPDSIPAWITAFTGKDPSEHGVLDHVNYLIKGEDTVEIDTTIFHKKTFWDKIGEADHQVCIINPFMAYPVWPVNGVMVSGPVFVKGEIQVSNPDYIKGKTFPGSIGGISDLPSRKNIESFYTSTVEKTKEQASYGLDVFKEKSPDLFFQTFLTTDRIQHHLWRYCDPTDPTYPGDNPVKNSITEFFTLVDKIIGDFDELLTDNDTLIIMSDHGHGMRCTHCFN